MTVCVFAKRPRPGRVKTRLAPFVGASAARLLAAAFVADTWRALAALPWVDAVLATDEDAPWWGRGLPGVEGHIWTQGRGDLGARIERVLSRALALGRPALAIGADTPGLPLGLIERAARAIGQPGTGAVIGPAADGGFYLLGVNTCPRGLLAGLPWSAPDTLRRALARLRARGLGVRVLPAWFDVDLPDDLERLRRAIREGRIAAPETALALREVARSRPGSANARRQRSHDGGRP